MPHLVSLQLHPPGDYVSDVIRQSGTWYEKAVLDTVRTHLARQPPGVLVDAGAMLGNHTVYLAAHVPHVAIHAFEPVPANLALLLANTRTYPTVQVHPLALSDQEGTLHLELDPANLGHAAAVPGGELPVPAAPLDTFALQGVALVKVDVEGHEPQVLAGAQATLSRWHPLVVLESWSGPPGALLPGYQLVAEWEQQHQTFMYEWAGGQA